MFKKVKILFFLIFILWLAFFSQQVAEASTLSAPVITKVSGPRLEITGTTPIGAEVLIYLDGKFLALAQTKNLNNQNDLFYYQQPNTLANGLYKIFVVAKDKTSLVLSPPSAAVELKVAPPAAPTLIGPNEKTVTGKVKPLIIGLTANQTFIKIYINGVYNGKTKELSHPSGTANFAYQPFLNLQPGWHQAWAYAEDELGNRSQLSNILNFKIELPMPAPTIFKPVVNTKTTSVRPFIVGLAKNNSKIKVYLDKKYQGEFWVANHPSGTANFAFLPPTNLAKGGHLVYTTAIDQRGKESIWSNIVYFTIKQPAIAQAVKEEQEQAVAKIEPTKSAAEQSIIISEKEGLVEPAEKQTENELKELADQGKITNQELKEIIDQTATSSKEQTGIINESKQNQAKLKLNLVIFIVFLVGVVAWMLWVNRELIKERRAESKKEKSEENKQENLKI